MSTKYHVYYYDPRGAWRLKDEYDSLASAKQSLKKDKMTNKWKIIKVDSVLVSQSAEEAVSLD